MAKTPIRTVPSELPHARIYLDDLVEIQVLLTDAYAEAHPDVVLSFAYEVDGITRYTTLDELADHGGYSNKFALVALTSNAGFIQPRVLTFSRHSAPELDLYRLREQEWELFARIEQIFRFRRDRLRGFMGSTSPQIAMVPLLVLPFVVIILPVRDVAQHPTSLLVALAISIGLMTAGIYVAFRSSRINLSYARQDQQAREKASKERIEKAAWLIFGAALGWIATIAVNFFRR